MKDSKIQNDPHFWRDNFFFENWVNYSAQVTCGSKISSKSLYLAGFHDTNISAFCIFEKNSKWPPFLASEIFAETWKG